MGDQGKSISTKIISIIIVCGIVFYGAWYGVNYFSAGLLKQELLIEFGYTDDFLWAHKWRPEKLNLEHRIEQYYNDNSFISGNYILYNDQIVKNQLIVNHSLLSFPHTDEKLLPLLKK